MNMTCEICRKGWRVDNSAWYDDIACPHCGQVYEYGEGNFIRLTPEQLAMLQRAYDEKA